MDVRLRQKDARQRDVDNLTNDIIYVIIDMLGNYYLAQKGDTSVIEGS